MTARTLIAGVMIAVTLALAPVAGAAEQRATCRFGGAAGTSTGAIGPMHGLTWGPGGSGYFRWSATAGCLVTLPSGEVISTGASLSSDGHFDNGLCGTFWAYGTMNVAFNDPRAAGLAPWYDLQVLSHQGTLRLSSGATQTGAGEVTWLPRDVQCLYDVEYFTMRGTFTVTGP